MSASPPSATTCTAGAVDRLRRTPPALVPHRRRRGPRLAPQPGHPRPQRRHRVPGRVGVPVSNVTTRAPGSPRTPSSAPTEAEAPLVSVVGGNGIRVQTGKLDDQQTDQVKEALAKAYGVPDTNVTSTFVGPELGSGRDEQGDHEPGRLPRPRVAGHHAVLPDLDDGGRSDRRPDARPADHRRDLRPGRLRGDTGLGHRLPDDPRVLAVRHGRRLRQGPREHRAHHGRRRSAPTPRPRTWPSTRRWSGRSTPRWSRCCRSARSSSSARSCSAPARSRTSSLALFVGIAAGTYSSIFIATPLLVELRMREPEMKAQEQRVLKRRREEHGSGWPSRCSPGVATAPARRARRRPRPRRRGRAERDLRQGTGGQRQQPRRGSGAGRNRPGGRRS